jgi:catechol 2,3-dioxygenase-like lactoylglutathione lyase family enzyme
MTRQKENTELAGGPGVVLSRRTLLGTVAAVAPLAVLSSRAWAEETLKGDELPLHTTGLEHIGMVVPDVEAAARFYSSLFNPDMQKEKDAPLRYYVMTGSGYIALGSRPGVTEPRVDHYCTLVRGYERERMNSTLAAKGIKAVARGVVPDPDGIGLQLIAVPGGPGPTAIPGGRLVEREPLVKPIGFDSILLKVADVQRSSDFYRHFFNTARAPEKGQAAFAAADTHIVLRPMAAGERPGVERYAMRVAKFDRAKVLKGLAVLGATPETKGPAGVVRFRDPNGLAVELKAV